MAKGPSKEQVKLQSEINALFKQGTIAAGEMTSMLADMNKMSKAQIQNATNHLATLRQSTAETKNQAKEAESLTKSKEDLKKLEGDILDLSKQMLKPLSQLGSLNKRAEGSRKLQKTLAIEDLNTKIAQVKAQKQLGNLTSNEAKKMMGGLKSQKAQIKNLSIIESKSPELAYGLAAASEQADQLQGNIDNFFSSIPGGDFLKKQFGFDQIGAQIQDGLVGGISAMGKSLAAGQSPIMALRAGMTAFNAVVALNPMILVIAGIAAAALALKALVGLASKHEEEARKLSDTMGITVGQSKQLIIEANAATGAMGNQLSMAEDILAVQQESAAAFGTMAMLSTDQAAAVSEIGKSFGYSAQQAGKVNSAFMAMGVSADEAASTQRELAADALKAGVNVGAVTADIAENSKATAKYFGGNVKALKKAAIEAAKMGVSLATMAKVSDSLLDFENSISAQFELQALTGKQMNFDLARQLALEGDIAGATKAVMDQVGSIHDFNKMDVLERKKLAEATGMDVDELQKSLTIKDKMGDLTSEELASMNALGLSAAQMASMSAEDLQTKLAGQQSSEKMSASFAAMKNQLVNALMPAAEAFMGIFAMLSPVLKVVGGVFKLIGAAIKGFLAPITFVFGIITSIKDAVAGVLDTFGFLQPVVAVLGFAFDAIKNTIMIAGGILGAVFLPNIIAAGVGAVSAAGGFIAAAIPAIFSAFGMIPFGLGIPLAIAAVAGMIGTTMSYMNDGVVSPQTGGGGYGSRTLFGPEGAISFNNKDTIVAGTNLFGQANDAVFAPAGAMKMNDGAVGDIPDPPEAKIVGIGGESVAKLSIGIAAAIGVGMVPAMIAGFTAFTPVLGAMLMTTLPMVGMATALATMPMTVAAITAGIMAGSLATALIPKPVIVLNPFIATFETNPLLMMGGLLGGLGSVFGGDKSGEKEDPVVAKLDQVISAINNMEINMDGQKVGALTRLADTFRRG